MAASNDNAMENASNMAEAGKVVRKAAAKRKPKAKTKPTATLKKKVAVASGPRKRPASEPTGARAAKLAINLLDFQKTTIGNGIALMGKVQSQTEKVIQKVLVRADWMPKEGKKLVEEWMRTVKKSREDYRKTVDKSFDLLIEYLQRLQREDSSRGGKAKSK